MERSKRGEPGSARLSAPSSVKKHKEGGAGGLRCPVTPMVWRPQTWPRGQKMGLAPAKAASFPCCRQERARLLTATVTRHSHKENTIQVTKRGGLE